MRTPSSARLRGLVSVIVVGSTTLWVGTGPSAGVGTPVGYPGNINTPDFNGDGAPDLAVVNFLNDTFSVRLNKGDGTFALPTRYPVGQQPSFIGVSDFDGNGTLDVALCNAVSHDVSVLLGNGDGSFQPARHYPLSDASQGPAGRAAGPFSLVAGDFDGDGHMDIAASNSATNNVSSLLGNGDGTFQAARTFPLLTGGTIGGIPFASATADFDGDGALDLVTGGSSGATLLRGLGDGRFVAYERHETGAAMSCLDIDDLDADGHLDIVASHWSSNYAVLLGIGRGSFTVEERKPSGGVAGECFDMGDLDGDGLEDLAIVNTFSSLGTGNVSILVGHGDGTFGPPLSYPVGQTPWASSIVDLDGDGRNDVAVANGVDTSVSVLVGNGDGTLRQERRLAM